MKTPSSLRQQARNRHGFSRNEVQILRQDQSPPRTVCENKDADFNALSDKALAETKVQTMSDSVLSQHQPFPIPDQKPSKQRFQRELEAVYTRAAHFVFSSFWKSPLSLQPQKRLSSPPPDWNHCALSTWTGASPTSAHRLFLDVSLQSDSSKAQTQFGVNCCQFSTVLLFFLRFLSSLSYYTESVKSHEFS